MACEKFSCYILGKRTSIETDHKSLLRKRNLDILPPRVLRFCLWLVRFDYLIAHVAGRNFYTADSLSRAPASAATEYDTRQEKETE